jgi:hypothetical protein
LIDTSGHGKILVGLAGSTSDEKRTKTALWLFFHIIRYVRGSQIDAAELRVREQPKLGTIEQGTVYPENIRCKYNRPF